MKLLKEKNKELGKSFRQFKTEVEDKLIQVSLALTA